MSASPSLTNLYRRLKEDPWRKKRTIGFSKDMKLVNEVLFHPFATDSNRQTAVATWLQRQQPCLFGGIAAAKDWMHYCFLKEDDFYLSDEKIAERIQEELLAWKRRSVRPRNEFSQPAHGFLLMAISRRIALAAPDENLKAFAEKIRDLWGCSGSIEASGTTHWETLFLENPADGSFAQFTFSVDFFASQGDRRWWHDHRVPGGIAFTANSVGHMRRYREWYLALNQQEEWVLKTAMETIEKAAETPYGRATWLKPLAKGGRPIVDRLACPFAEPTKLKEQLQNKDWTRYGGYLHTDHSIRSEFFHEDPKPAGEITSREYLQDFAYLYDTASNDYVRFILGSPIAAEELTKLIGTPESWVKIRGSRLSASRAKRSGAKTKPAAALQGENEVKLLLQKCSRWSLTPEEMAAASE